MKGSENPNYLFSTAYTGLLVLIANNEIDPVKLAIKELASRGCNDNGNFVGFKKAKQRLDTFSTTKKLHHEKI